MSIDRVKIKKGTFYLSQDNQVDEDWTKQEFNNPQTGEPMVKYHKELAVKGKINYVDMKDDRYAGKVLALLVNNGQETFGLELPIMSNKGVKTTEDFFNSVVGPLQNVNKGDEITMFVNNKNEDKNGRLYRNIIILDSEGKLIKSDFSFADVPKWNSSEVVDDFGEKKTVYDAGPTNKFYIDLANKLVAKFNPNQD